MTMVLTFGVWDLFHAGHLAFLKRAAHYGDLIVGVQTDDDVFNEKGRLPTIEQHARADIIENLSCVTGVILYEREDYLKIYTTYLPDVLVLSEQHKGIERFAALVERAHDDGCMVRYLPYTQMVSSTTIKQTIKETPENPWDAVWERVGEDNTIPPIQKNSPARTGENNKEAAAYVKYVLNIGCYDTLVDFGCGTGLIASAILDGGGEITYIGIDNANTMLNRAIDNAPSAIFIKSDTLHVWSNVDAVFGLSVLRYLPSPWAALHVLHMAADIAKKALFTGIFLTEDKEKVLAARKAVGKADWPPSLFLDRKDIEKEGYTLRPDTIPGFDNNAISWEIRHGC